MGKHENKLAGPQQSRAFSEELQGWMKSKGDKTLESLNRLSGEKSFAIIFLLLMALPALPIPTAGITHLTELITVLLALELIIGREDIWLPQRWMDVNAGKLLSGKAGGRLIAFIRWFERLSRRRWSGLLVQKSALSVVGLIILIFAVAAFVAPPFSGLDTLPSLGVVIISLGLILEDSLIVLAGIVVGAAGIGLEVAAGAALYNGFRHFL